MSPIRLRFIGFRWLSDCLPTSMRQLSFALRGLRRSKAYAFITLATLAIAIGANTAVFSVLYAVLLQSLPYPEPSRLLEIGRSSGSAAVASVTYPDYERWRDGARGFTSLAAYFQNTGISRVTLNMGEEPEAAKAAFVSASFFEVMGVPPRLGRVFTRAEEESREPVAVISHALWLRHFGGSDSLDGAVLRINELAYRVIGVMPASFAWPARDMAAWIPITLNGAWARRAGPVPLFRVVGRLAPSVTRAAAAAELQSIYASTVDGTTGVAGAVPLRPPLAGNHERTLYFLMAAVGFLLLIACANIASLTLARGNKRASELALRVALGAGRARVAAEMFVESLLLSLAGAALGMLLGSFGIDFLVRFRPANIERMNEAGLGGGVLVFTLAVTLGSAVLFGFFPAWQMSARDPIEALRGLSRGASSGARGVRLRKLLVAAELALTLMLLAGSGLMLRSLAAAQKVDLGFDASRALTFRVLFQDGTPAERKIDYFRTLFDRLSDVPQVYAAGAVYDLFEVFAPGTLGLRAVEGRAPEPRDVWTPLTWTAVGGRYFEAMGAQLVRGRWFTEADGPTSPLVAVIDESAARRYFLGEDPIGRRFKGQDERGLNDDWLTVIGVVGNMRRQGIDREPTAHIYEWYRQANTIPRDVVVRTVAASFGTEVRAIARSLDPTVVLSGVKTVESELDDQLSTRRFQATLLSTFAGIAVLLAVVGVYGVVSYSVTMRLREFGIRAALGESRTALRCRILREASITAMAGILPGLCAAAVLSGLVRSLVFGVSVLDPVSLVASCVLLTGTAIAAAYVPALRASGVDPAIALREE
jgi:putative ABC transport system permease protein